MNAQFKKWQRKWILVGIRKLRKQERNILGIKDASGFNFLNRGPELN